MPGISFGGIRPLLEPCYTKCDAAIFGPPFATISCMKRTNCWYWLAIIWLLALSGCSVGEQQADTPTRPTADQAAVPTIAPVQVPARPTPTFVPTGGTVAAATGQTVRLEDDVWQGSYRRSGGSSVYGGRSATWIYGVGTDYSAMQAQFEVVGQPRGTADLRVEGMDSEGAAKTRIQITINGTPIFDGPNPLPDDDQPLDSGTWATAAWSFDAALLQPGTNVVQVINRSPGQFSRPPFFMLDYAEIRYQTQ